MRGAASKWRSNFARTARLIELVGTRIAQSRCAGDCGAVIFEEAVRAARRGAASECRGAAHRVAARRDVQPWDTSPASMAISGARDTYELARELAERIGQSEIQARSHWRNGALPHLSASSRRRRGSEPADESAARSRCPDWFQGRELVEALAIHLAVRRTGRCEPMLCGSRRFEAEAQDLYGALLADSRIRLRPFWSTIRRRWTSLVRRLRGRPEVCENRHDYGNVRCIDAGQCTQLLTARKNGHIGIQSSAQPSRAFDPTLQRRASARASKP